MRDPVAEEMESWLFSYMPEAMRWLQRMVEVNSFTTNPRGVNLVGRITAECFEDLGFSAEMVPSDITNHGDHLFLTRAGKKSGRPVWLVSHLDTVFPPEEEKANHFHWDEALEEGRIYGPGTVDIKGGTILIWLTLQALRHFAPDVFESTSWVIAANSSEEVMSVDFALRAKERCPQGAQMVLVFEGGPHEGAEQRLVTARKGRAEYRITAHGKAAHAGSGLHLGVNAIVGLSDVVKRVAALNDLSPELTVNVATINGGTVLNRVPHVAAIGLEMRAFDPEVLAKAGKAIQALAVPDPAEGEPAILVDCLGQSPGWPRQPASQKLFEEWQLAALSMGMQLNQESRGGLSDANYLNTLGPTLDGLGPNGGNAHCSERTSDGSKLPEYVDIASFTPKATLNALALMRVLER